MSTFAPRAFLALFAFVALTLLSSCTSSGAVDQQKVRDAVSVGAPAVCKLIEVFDGPEKIGNLCEELAPFVPNLLAMRRAARAGKPLPCPDKSSVP